MKRLKYSLLVCLLACSTFAQSEPRDADRVSILAHQNVAADLLSLRDLRAIFSMKKRFWKDGSPITVFVLPSYAPLHKAFCKKTLNVFPNQLEAIWYRQVYTGTGKAPVQVASEQEMYLRISQTPGAIGYVAQQDETKKNANDKTKILAIN